MRTHMILHVSSEGLPASETVRRLRDVGFETTLGRYDFVYDWKDKKPTLDDVISFVDQVIEKMKGTQVTMHFSTND